MLVAITSLGNVSVRLVPWAKDANNGAWKVSGALIVNRSVNVRMVTDVMLSVDFANAFLVGLDNTVRKSVLLDFMAVVVRRDAFAKMMVPVIISLAAVSANLVGKDNSVKQSVLQTCMARTVVRHVLVSLVLHVTE